jgi:antitoxin FitA
MAKFNLFASGVPYDRGMASITIRRLDDAVKEHLRVRASRHGRSMEEEAREILTVALAMRASIEPNWVESFRRRVAAVGGVELPDLPREPMREPPDFGE